MTRERKEILKKLAEAATILDADLEMGAGFGADVIYNNYDKAARKIYSKLAATYGMTLEEYTAKVERISYELLQRNVIARNDGVVYIMMSAPV